MKEIPLSFMGPFVLDQKKEFRAHYPTLTHWIEASKFDAGAQMARREEILLTPSPSQASRRSRVLQCYWRDDWQMIKQSVIVQGICIYYLENQILYGDPAAKAKLLEQISSSGSSAMMADSLHGLAVSQLSAARVAFLGNATAEEVSKKVRSVQKKYSGRWMLVHWRGRHSNAVVHANTLAERKPVVYCGAPGQRLAGIGFTALVKECEHFVVFKGGDGQAMEQLIQDLKSLGKTVEVTQETKQQAKSGTKVEAPNLSQVSLF